MTVPGPDRYRIADTLARHYDGQPLALPDEPDLVHLAVYEWLPQFGEWATYSTALCGHSTEQGALPDGAAVTCQGCEERRPAYERHLAARGKSPEQQLEEVRGLLSQWAPQLGACS